MLRQAPNVWVSRSRSDTLSQDPRAEQGYMHYSNMHHPMHHGYMHRYILSPIYTEACSTSQGVMHSGPQKVA